MQRGAGGTSGGLWEFLIGTVMVLIGGYLFSSRLVVSSTFRALWGGSGSGIALLILLIGIGVLFFSGRSRIGWIMILVGAAGIIISVITNLVVYYTSTSLLETVIILGLIFGGLGLVARALRPH